MTELRTAITTTIWQMGKLTYAEAKAITDQVIAFLASLKP